MRKLMRVSERWESPLCAVRPRSLGRAVPAFLLASLCGCPLPPSTPAPHSTAGPPADGAAHGAGTPFQVAAADSLLVVRVYRAGVLASAGHNHVIASHDLGGSVFVPCDRARTTFVIDVPVTTLTVDEPELRAAEPGTEFPPDVPESAREGTRKNMLSAAVLDGGQFARVTLRGERLEPNGSGVGVAEIESTVRAAVRRLEVPVRYRLEATTLSVTADFPLRQSDLGLQPFSAMLGALQVADEMHVSVRLVAHAALAPQCSPSSTSSASAL